FFLGLSHRHDGYDSTTGFAYGDVDDAAFVSVGDESDTVMGYLFDSTHFDVFDVDNANRYATAGELNRANALLGAVLRAPGVTPFRPALLRADADAAKAIVAFQRWDYPTAAVDARAADVEVANVAAALHVALPTAATPAASSRTTVPANQARRPVVPGLLGRD